jgi:hypothetical protein
MGAITGTLDYGGELGGNTRLVVVTAPVAANSDDITLTKATHGISAITSIVGAVITGGHDEDFTVLEVSYSGLVITVASFDAEGTVADEFTGTTVSITVIGTY